ncbi:tetratricopeptide repeat protein [Breoghania sp.]|uniref:tetratricopeptide repeat protein n=1 Tax=Breoghania sp. TaxID=2065378 RepID=UPI0026185BC1|nr:tetratricopeptide repeat protein [Breoghania sp.]MDJ0929575.1 tetratricopeptide repeat protein [Breoghania sp.]
MRNTNAILCLAGILALLPFGASYAFDPGAASEKAQTTPTEAFRLGARAYFAGNKQKAVDALSFAAENGVPAAQWKLGRMYADGDGVAEDDLKAFKYFSRIASQHADDAPSSSQAPYVASAFVAIGSYYLTGIQDTAVKPNIRRAREIFTYAASYFGNADAQYNLGRIYLEGSPDDPPDLRMAARWLKLAALKGHYQAQATLGKLLFFDETFPSNRIRGLMWLTIALPHAHGDKDAWIVDTQERAFSLAGEAERRRAMTLAQRWQEKAVASR